MKYPVVIHKDPDSDYGASFPDLPGCITADSSIDSVMEMAHEAASAHIEALIDLGYPVPAAGKVENYVNDPDYADALLWSFVEVAAVPHPV